MRDAEALTEFLSESWELLDLLDRELVLLENETDNTGVFNSIFRVMHTLKGNAGFLAFSGIERLAHISESLLEKVRDEEFPLDSKFMDLLFRTADQLRMHFLRLEKEGQEGPRDETLLSALQSHLDGEVVEDTLPEPIPAAELETVQPVKKQFSKVPPEETSETVETAEPLLDEPGAESFPVEGTSKQDQQYAKVRVDLLDRLMNLMGELVLCRNELLQKAMGLQDDALHKGTQRLDLVTAELQEKIGQTRMQPLERLTSRFPRMVRDLAKEVDKEIQLKVIGQDTGLDRTLLEAIRDPLLHLIRNSVDHGIEGPEQRLAIGKPSVGTITVRACHEGGQVKIEVSDDGRGINAGEIRRQAIERGVFSTDQSQRISDSEVVRLVFEAGFSTAQAVTRLSGRGVGMDVVRASIEGIGGTVDLFSQPGEGTTVTLRIPLTLAIIPALMVELGQQSYAIPQINLQEIVHLERHLLEAVHGTEVYRLRGSLIPLLRLRKLFGVEGEDPDANIVVVQADGRPYGLVVDSRCDTAEIVVKPLPSDLKDLPHYAGATITGQGRVALILDIGGIARREGLLFQEEGALSKRSLGMQERKSDREQPLLLFRLGDQEVFGIPLALVSRLEEFPLAEIRRTAGRQAIEYRGRLLPLICLASAMGRENNADESVQVLVFSDGERRLGVMVNEIVDIVDEAFELDPEMGNLTGILGSAIVQGQAVTVVDVLGMLRRAHPEWLRRVVHRDVRARDSRVLLAHDSDFFRAITRSYLESEGYDVVEATRKEDAMDFLSRERVDSVVVDLDMEGSRELLIYASGEHPALGVKTTLKKESGEDEIPTIGVPIVDDIDRDGLIEALRRSVEVSREDI